MLKKIGNLILLSALFTVFSIPVVTMGASIAAMYLTFAEYKNDNYILGDFIKNFTSCLKKATPRWLAILLGGTVSVCGIFLSINYLPGTISSIFVIFFALCICIYVMSGMYLIPFSIHSDKRFNKEFKYCFILSIKHFDVTVVIALIGSATAFFLYLNWLLVLLIMALMGFALYGWLYSHLLTKNEVIKIPTNNVATLKVPVLNDYMSEITATEEERTKEKLPEEETESIRDISTQDKDSLEENTVNDGEEENLDNVELVIHPPVKEKSIIISDAAEDERNRILKEKQAELEKIRFEKEQANEAALKVSAELASRVKESTLLDTSGENTYRRPKEEPDSRRGTAKSKKRK